MIFRTASLIILLAGTMAWAQEGEDTIIYPTWQKTMIGSVNLTQTGFDNWVAGGENSFAWQVNLNFKFVKDTQASIWSTSGKLAYGSTKTGDDEARKAVDELKLESVFTYKTWNSINPFIAVTGETQFAAGYNYGNEIPEQISDYMDPGYFRQSIGFGYKGDDLFSTRIGIALKQTVTNIYPIPYTDNPETENELEKTKNEKGGEWVSDINWKISANTQVTSKMELFTSFNAIDETDVNWDNSLMVKISKYFNVNLNLNVVYDKDISTKRQIKQSTALGLIYTFI